MELYEYARPDVMEGKKILYVHGFASSGQNGTVRTMRTLLPNTEIIAPDLPVEPDAALDMLKSLCAESRPDLILGTSMGGMYAEQLKGFDRILVNPAFTLADTLLKNNGLGRQEYHSPRQDGQTSFLVNKGLIEDFRRVSAQCFADVPSDMEEPGNEGRIEGEQEHVYGMFGTHDELVDTYAIFASHYPRAIRFDGGHYLDDKVFLHSVLPVIQRIDDIQNGKSRKTILVSLPDVLMDIKNGRLHDARPEDYEPCNGAVKSFTRLCEKYDCWIYLPYTYNNPETLPTSIKWIESSIGVTAWNRVITAPRKDMLLGDYLIDRYTGRGEADNFMGTVLHFGEEPFRNWEEIVDFFTKLNGQ